MLKQKFNQLANKIKTAAQSDEAVVDDRLIVALDIGTENIKALIASNDRNDIKVIGVGRMHQGYEDMHAGAISDIEAVVANCDKALAEAEKQANAQAGKAIIGLAGELVKGITNTYTHKRPKSSQPMELSEVDQIIRRAQAQAYAKAQHEVALEVGRESAELKLINSAIISFTIDGYKVTNPVGFQGRNVQAQVYTAFAPLVHIGAIERVVDQLDLELMAVAAEPFAVARSVVDDQDSSANVILIDVGGGTTDIAVVRDGCLEGTKMFGIGGRAFTSVISREMNLDFDAAEQLKLRVDSAEASPEEAKQATKAMQKTAAVWIRGVALALSEFDWIDQLPNQIFLCGGGASLSLIQQSLGSGRWYKDLPINKPNIRFIKPDEVVAMTDQTNKLTDHTVITAMGLLRVGVDSQNNAVSEKRSKLDKILEN